MKKCEFGCGHSATFLLKNGKWCCSLSVNSCPGMRKKNSGSLKGKAKWVNRPHPRGMLGRSHRFSGKTYEEIYGDRAEEMVAKRAESNRGNTGVAKTKDGEDKRRRNISSSMKGNPKVGGYRKGSGRGKKGWYKGYWCDSSWELAWVIYNLEHGIRFQRNKQKYPYQWNGENHSYLPDFILDDDELIEIKGWVDEKTKVKISSCAKSVTVLTKKEMSPILQYVIDKYGKGFISLYGE